MIQENEEENKFDSTQASIEESKEIPAKPGKLTFTIESAKIPNIGKNTNVSASFEWSGETLKTGSQKGANPKWNEVSLN